MFFLFLFFPWKLESVEEHEYGNVHNFGVIHSIGDYDLCLYLSIVGFMFELKTQTLEVICIRRKFSNASLIVGLYNG